MLPDFKYFAIVVFLLISVVAFFAGEYFRSYAAEKVILNPIGQQNVATINSFTKNIWCKYEPSFRELSNKPAVEWANNKEFAKLSKMVRTIFVVSPAAKVSFYNQSKEEVLTTTDNDIIFFHATDLAEGISQAFVNKVNSELVPSAGYQSQKGDLVKGSFVRSFIPIDYHNCPNMKAEDTPLKIAVSVATDVTKPWNDLYFFQILFSIVIIIAFILLCFALFIISKKTEAIISKQHEERLKLEKAKATAEAQNQQKSMFLANVSHELRTPLNAIIGFSDIIKDEVMGPIGHPQYKEYLNDINASGVHLLSLINDILDYSKAEAQKLEVEFVDIDISKIAQSCLRLFEPRAKQAKINLVKRFPEKHIILSADPKRIKQVILNLMSNSIKFTHENGHVELAIEEHILEGKINIIVSDNGIGISAKDIPKALAPFGQIDSSLSRKYEGTGLGLPLTKKLTEIMGGKFDIMSEVGVGTTVILSFPIVYERKA